MKPSNPPRLLQPAARDPHGESKPFAQPLRYAALVPKSFSKRLHRKQAAEHLGVSLSWLDKARGTGLGPPFICVGARVVYDSGDLDEFLQKNRRRSTSEET